jgi:hypothetical protein
MGCPGWAVQGGLPVGAAGAGVSAADALGDGDAVVLADVAVVLAGDALVVADVVTEWRARSVAAP